MGWLSKAKKSVKKATSGVAKTVSKAGDWAGDRATSIAQDPLGGVGNVLYESSGRFGGIGHVLGEDTMRDFVGNPFVQAGVGGAASFLPGAGPMLAPLLTGAMGAYGQNNMGMQGILGGAGMGALGMGLGLGGQAMYGGMTGPGGMFNAGPNPAINNPDNFIDMGSGQGGGLGYDFMGGMDGAYKSPYAGGSDGSGGGGSFLSNLFRGTNTGGVGGGGGGGGSGGTGGSPWAGGYGQGLVPLLGQLGGGMADAYMRQRGMNEARDAIGKATGTLEPYNESDPFQNEWAQNAMEDTVDTVLAKHSAAGTVGTGAARQDAMDTAMSRVALPLYAQAQNAAGMQAQLQSGAAQLPLDWWGRTGADMSTIMQNATAPNYGPLGGLQQMLPGLLQMLG